MKITPTANADLSESEEQIHALAPSKEPLEKGPRKKDTTQKGSMRGINFFQNKFNHQSLASINLQIHVIF